MADALPPPVMVMRFMCAHNVFVCGYALMFICLFVCILFSCSHAQVVVLVKIIHRHYSAITLVKALAHSTRLLLLSLLPPLLLTFLLLVALLMMLMMNTETIAS